jgi:hypothetical protein
MWTAVHENFAPDVCAALIDDENASLLRQLDDFGRKRSGHRARPTGREAEALGIVLRFVQTMVVVDRRRPWLKWDEGFVRRATTLSTIEAFGCIGRVACKILDRWQTPDPFLTAVPSQIDGAIGKPRRRFCGSIQCPAARCNRAGGIDHRPDAPDLGKDDCICRNDKNQSQLTIPHKVSVVAAGKS